MRSTDVNDVLCKLIQSHGVECRHEGDWLVFPDSRMRMYGTVFHHETSSDRCSVQLDVCLELWTGRLLAEACGGLGRTESEAIQDAFRGFSSNALHVVLAVFFSKPAEDQISRQEWPIRGIPRSVTIGPATSRGEPPGAELGWWDALAGAIQGSDLPPGTHWIRFYVAQAQGEIRMIETLLDNEHWETLHATMATFPWPRRDGFYSLRNFLIVQGGPDVSRAAALVADNNGLDDGALTGLLVANGFSRTDANRLIVFLPLAFGREVLRKLGARFPDEAVLRVGSRETTIRLGDEPFFLNAVRLAEQAVREGPRNLVEPIANRSSEMHAANQALHAGASLASSVFSPPIIWLPQEEPVPVAAGTSPKSAPESKGKPWWRFGL